jgi:hypothetical protein
MDITANSMEIARSLPVPMNSMAPPDSLVDIIQAVRYIKATDF